jgi:type VI secretion system protein ImpK
MGDNPFSEPEDSDRTVIRPMPGGRRPIAPRPTVPVRPHDPAPPRDPSPPRDLAPLTGGAEPIAVGGTPLAVAAAPLLQLLGRLRNTATAPDSGDLRERAVKEVRRFEHRARDAGIPMEQLRPAHYALCASLDDVVLNTPWGSSGAWATESLTTTFHQEARGDNRFFDLLKQMSEAPGKFLPVIELMYLCMSLGYMGRFRLAPRGPAELDRMREETYAVIAAQHQAEDPALSAHWKGVAAPYKPKRAALPVWVGASAGLAAVAGLFLWFSTGLNAASDDLYARMLGAQPAAMPQIIRTTLVQPLPPPPDPAEPSELDRLRAALKPEIARGEVAVLGTPTTPILRISDRGLFPAASATLQAAAKPLLARIGVVLKDAPGPVQVIGYTDDQPVRSVKFPSNFQLSAARAQAVRAIVAHDIGDPGRVTAEGRAAADPVAPNKTPEGRAQNRRIDILLHHQDATP